MSVTCRPQTTGGVPSTPKSPIRHPLSGLGQHNSLKVRGSSAAPNIMSFRDLNNEHYHYILPNRLNESLDFSVPQRRRHDVRGVLQMSLDEIEQTIENKLRKERYAVQCLFLNNDTSGRGYVTKGALLKIMYTLCGSIRVEHFHQLLEKYGLDEFPVINFHQFQQAFGPRIGNRSEPNRFRATRLSNRHVTVAHAQTMLRERAQHPHFDLKQTVPESCFLPGGIILKPQWREALEVIGIHMSDQNFEKFWERFDREGTGAIRTAHLCSILHLDDDGRPVSSTLVPRPDPSFTRSKADDATRCESQKSKSAVPKSSDSKAETEREDQGDTGKVPKRVITGSFRTRLERTGRPRFETIRDNLFYLFDEVNSAVYSALQQHDHKGSGYISGFDFRQVLKGFGFEIPTQELDAFLSRIGLGRGSVNYKEFCNKFHSRAEHGLVSRILTNMHHIIHENPRPQRTYIHEQCEAKICEFFQEHFMKLLGLLQRSDPEKKGLLPPNTVHTAIDEVLGFKTTDEQFEDFSQYLKRDNKTGDINYNDMLRLFSKPVKTWKSGIEASYQKKLESTPLAKTYPVSLILAAQPASFNDRTPTNENEKELRYAELCILVDDILHKRFHSIDKLYKKMDFRNTDHLGKSLFGELLFHHGLTLKDADLDRLWSTIDPEAEQHMHYRQVLRHFMTTLREEAHKSRLKVKQSRFVTGMQDPNMLRLREFRKQKREQTANAAQEPPAIEAPVLPYDVSEERANELCERVRQQVVNNWEPLKDCLRSLDQVGYSTVNYKPMKKIADQLGFNLTEMEMNELLSAFDHKKEGRFNYIDFLKKFTTPVENGTTTRYHKLTHKLQDKKTGRSETVVKILEKIRQHLINDWKTLLRAFRKLDNQRTGFISLDELKRILREQHFYLSDDDIYHLLTEFDVNLDGRIVYQEFIKQLLNVF